MTFADLVRGDSVFLDANTFVYHFQPHSAFGPPCTDLLKRIELQELSGYTSTHVLSELAHRLMTMEASALFNWASKIVQRLQQNPAHVRRLKGAVGRRPGAAHVRADTGVGTAREAGGR